MPPPLPPILLLGYPSSLFTNKIRLALHLLRLPSTYITVPPLPPRPLLLRTLALPYRKIPVLCLARDVYVDTTLITAALESPRLAAPGPPLVGNENRALQRLWTRFFAEAPLFRTSTGLVPPRVWRAPFGADRGELVGHALDPDKLAKKVPWNFAQMDTWLSVLEGQFGPGRKGRRWLLETEEPGLVDLGLFAQLEWGFGIAVGKGVEALTRGEAVRGLGAEEEDGRGREWVGRVWREERYPGLWRWFHAFGDYVDGLPWMEEVVDGVLDVEKERILVERLGGAEEVGLRESMVGMAAQRGEGAMDDVVGLRAGTEVVIAPDDTGRADPTYGTLLATSAEEIVIKPRRIGHEAPLVDVRVHFPRMGFMVRPNSDQPTASL